MTHTYILETIPATHYTGALTTDAVESESIPGLRGDGQGVIKNIILTSAENLAWQVELYDADGTIINYHKFAVGDGYQLNAVGTYTYQISDADWSIPLTVPNITVEIGIRNRSEQSKSAGTDGAITLKLVIVKG